MIEQLLSTWGTSLLKVSLSPLVQVYLEANLAPKDGYLLFLRKHNRSWNCFQARHGQLEALASGMEMQKDPQLPAHMDPTNCAVLLEVKLQCRRGGKPEVAKGKMRLKQSNDLLLWKEIFPFLQVSTLDVVILGRVSAWFDESHNPCNETRFRDRVLGQLRYVGKLLMLQHHPERERCGGVCSSFNCFMLYVLKNDLEIGDWDTLRP